MNWSSRTGVLCFCMALSLSGQPVAGQQSLSQDAADRPFDVLILNGRIMDGTGNPWHAADVGLRDGRIVAIGALGKAAARRTIDATNLIVAPGFIDLHSHAAEGLLSEDVQRRAAPNLVSQGITTIVLNPDGRSTLPVPEQKRRLNQCPFGPNIILMVGHNSVRQTVMKHDYRRSANADEIEQMKQLVAEGMEAGAFGLTAGLEYSPGIWSKTDELIALVEQIVPYDGAFIVHERASGADPFWYFPSQHSSGQSTMIDNIQELIEVAETTRAKVVATHIKARGANFWGSSRVIIQLIEQARARGVRIYADQYPYNSSGSDGRLVLIPAWLRNKMHSAEGHSESNYARQLERALKDDALRADLEQDVAHVIVRRGGAEQIVVMDHPNRQFVGKSLKQLANDHHISPVNMAFHLQLHGFPDQAGGARLRSYSMSELDVEAFASQPWTATATDAGIALVEDGPVHARFYGSFPRKIRHYAVERGLMTVENAVRSSTSLPAQILGLQDRGQVRIGFHADLILFDPDTIRDRATFAEPHQHAEGIQFVMIGGTPVVEQGTLTRKLPGRIIKRGSSTGHSRSKN